MAQIWFFHRSVNQMSQNLTQSTFNEDEWLGQMKMSSVLKVVTRKLGVCNSPICRESGDSANMTTKPSNLPDFDQWKIARHTNVCVIHHHLNTVCDVDRSTGGWWRLKVQTPNVNDHEQKKKRDLSCSVNVAFCRTTEGAGPSSHTHILRICKPVVFVTPSDRTRRRAQHNVTQHNAGGHVQHSSEQEGRHDVSVSCPSVESSGRESRERERIKKNKNKSTIN